MGPARVKTCASHESVEPVSLLPSSDSRRQFLVFRLTKLRRTFYEQIERASFRTAWVNSRHLRTSPNDLNRTLASSGLDDGSCPISDIRSTIHFRAHLGSRGLPRVLCAEGKHRNDTIDIAGWLHGWGSTQRLVVLPQMRLMAIYYAERAVIPVIPR
jgi:hypothetical protein